MSTPFNLNEIFVSLKDILIEVFLIPFRLWNRVPEPIRDGIFILLVLIAAFLLFRTYKKRNNWRHLDH